MRDMVHVTVGVAAVRAASRNARRKTISFTNTSAGGQGIHLGRSMKGGLTTTNSEYYLAAGDSLHFVEFFDGRDIRDQWDAIATGAGADLTIGETSDYEGS